MFGRIAEPSGIGQVDLLALVALRRRGRFQNIILRVLSNPRDKGWRERARGSASDARSSWSIHGVGEFGVVVIAQNVIEAAAVVRVDANAVDDRNAADFAYRSWASGSQHERSPERAAGCKSVQFQRHHDKARKPTPKAAKRHKIAARSGGCARLGLTSRSSRRRPAAQPCGEISVRVRVSSGIISGNCLDRANTRTDAVQRHLHLGPR